MIITSSTTTNIDRNRKRMGRAIANIMPVIIPIERLCLMNKPYMSPSISPIRAKIANDDSESMLSIPIAVICDFDT